MFERQNILKEMHATGPLGMFKLSGEQITKLNLQPSAVKQLVSGFMLIIVL